MSFEVNFTEYDDAQEFREEEHLFTRFYYDKSDTVHMLSRCAEYFYRKIGADLYWLVCIDTNADELTVNEQLSAEQLVQLLNLDASNRELGEYKGRKVHKLIPGWTRKGIRNHFNPLTGNLYIAAAHNNDSNLKYSLIRARWNTTPKPHE